MRATAAPTARAGEQHREDIRPAVDTEPLEHAGEDNEQRHPDQQCRCDDAFEPVEVRLDAPPSRS